MKGGVGMFRPQIKVVPNDAGGKVISVRIV